MASGSRDRVHEARARPDHRRLHARGRRAQPRAPDRLDLPQGGARVCRGHAPLEARDPSGDRDRAARQAPLLGGGEAAYERAGRGHRPGVDARGRRRAVRGGDRLSGRRQAADHRPARRRDEGVGRRGAVIREEQDGDRRARQRRVGGVVQEPRSARAHPGRSDSEGRPERGRHDGNRHRISGHVPSGARRRCHDRRAHTQRNGAADRRAEGEGARRTARQASGAL